MKGNQQEDYFQAYLENGGLSMEPRCRCGEQLDDTYFCTACNRDCRCTTFVCDNQETLAAVERFIEDQPSFRSFEAVLAGD